MRVAEEVGRMARTHYSPEDRKIRAGVDRPNWISSSYLPLALFR